MDQGVVMFSFMTFVFSVTVALVISTFESGTVNTEHALLKYGFTFPALLLMVDMWIQYNRYHAGGKQCYNAYCLFLDTILLTLMYASLANLKNKPPRGATFDAKSYPPQAFWCWLVPYSILKIIRCWPMSQGETQWYNLTWYSALHILLLGLIILGKKWQKDEEFLGIPFKYSGITFSVIVLIYLLLVYAAQLDPLKPVLKSRSGAAKQPVEAVGQLSPPQHNRSMLAGFIFMISKSQFVKYKMKQSD